MLLAIDPQTLMERFPCSASCFPKSQTGYPLVELSVCFQLVGWP